MKIPAALALAGLIGLGAAAPTFAQQPPAPPAGGPAAQAAPGVPGGPRARAERPLPGRYVEGRIAFLKAELRITDQQAPLWDRYATVMRSNAAAMNQAATERRAAPQPPPEQNAADRMLQRARMAEQHASAARASADAFKPLYDSLSEEQKKAANELMSRPMGGPRGDHRGDHRDDHQGPHRGGPRHG